MRKNKELERLSASIKMKTALVLDYEMLERFSGIKIAAKTKGYSS